MDVTKVFGSLSDAEWLDILKMSVKTNYINGIVFPGFPSAQLQAQFVGSSFEGALNEAGKFYSDAKRLYIEQAGEQLSSLTRILDFGVGWGRIIRFFWRDVGESNLFGVDVDPDILDVCKETKVPGNFSKIQPLGYLPFPDGYFDFVFAYSVFTHLAENTHLHWMNEIKRVLRPNGIFVGTIEPRRFIDFIANIPEDTPSNWHKSLRNHAIDLASLYEIFDNGDLVYLPTGGGKFRDASFYGDAIVPIKYIQRKWIDFDVCKYIDDPKEYWQALFCAKRK
jgi:SAM-dependent methyltransferase